MIRVGARPENEEILCISIETHPVLIVFSLQNQINLAFYLNFDIPGNKAGLNWTRSL